MNAKTIAVRVLLASIPIAGVVLAISVLIGNQDVFDISATAGFIFLADIYIVASLASRHRWLRIAIWVGAVITLAVSLTYTWMPDGEHYIWSQSGELLSTTPLGYLSSVNISLHMGVVTLILIAFFSFTFRFIRDRAAFVVCYLLAAGLGLGAWLMLSLDSILESAPEIVSRLGIALLITAVTCVAVVIVGAIVRATSLKQSGADQPTPIAAAPASSESTADLETLVARLVDERLQQLGVSPRKE